MPSADHSWPEVAAATRAVAIGATWVRESDDPQDRFVVLCDPEGNEFCLVC